MFSEQKQNSHKKNKQIKSKKHNIVIFSSTDKSL